MRPDENQAIHDAVSNSLKHHEEQGTHDAATSLKSLPWSLEDGRTEEEIYEEALHDISIMERTVLEQQKHINHLKDVHRTQLELIQIVVSGPFPLQ